MLRQEPCISPLFSDESLVDEDADVMDTAHSQDEKSAAALLVALPTYETY